MCNIIALVHMNCDAVYMCKTIILYTLLFRPGSAIMIPPKYSHIISDFLSHCDTSTPIEWARLEFNNSGERTHWKLKTLFGHIINVDRHLIFYENNFCNVFSHFLFSFRGSESEF